MRNRRLLLLAVLLLALAGCSSGGAPPATQGTSPAPSSGSVTGTSGSPGGSASPSTPATDQTAAPPSSPEPGDVSTSLNAIDALRNQSCTAAADGSWTFKGTLVNGTGSAKTYTVAIAVTVGAALQGHALITQTVQPGMSADVLARNFARTTGGAGTCEPVVSAEDAH